MLAKLRCRQCRKPPAPVYTFVAGERFTVADATTLAAVDFAGWSEIKIPESCRHLRRRYDTVNQRPSAKA